MGAMDSFFSRIGLNTSNEYDEEDYYEEEEQVEDPKAIRKLNKVEAAEEDNSKKSNKVTSMSRKRTNIGGMEVYGVKPKDIDDAREITQTLLENKIVLINLEGVSSGNAERILDFAAGSAYALNASFQKISSAIYIVAPESVEITGAFQDIINA